MTAANELRATIGALPPRTLSDRAARLLARFDSWEELQACTIRDLADFAGCGRATAREVEAWAFAHEHPIKGAIEPAGADIR